MTLYESFKQCALSHNRQDAIVFYGRRITFGRLLSLVDRTAYGLKNDGVKKNDVVTLCVPNSPSAAIAFYAINKLGAIANLVHPFAKWESVKHSMKKTGSKLLVTFDMYMDEVDCDCKKYVSDSGYFMPAIKRTYFHIANRKKRRFDKNDAFEKLFDNPQLSETEKNDGATVFLPSGGSTGEPKIIMHGDAAFNGLCDNIDFFLSEEQSSYKAMYSVLPIFHGFGLCMNLHMCMTKGITSIMTLKFNPKEMAKAIAQYKVNILTGVPAMYNKLLVSEEFLKTDLSSLKDCFVGGDKASAELISKFNEVLARGGSNAKLHVGYGLTETVTVCAVTTAERDKIGSVGYPLPGAKFCISDGENKLPCGEIGELCIQSPLLMLGYYGTDQTPIREFCGEKWLFTGDLCYLDEDGYLYFKQRIKNMIKVNGVPVFPSEIEEVVSAIEGVKHAAAIGVPDKNKGESVKLFVEPRQNVDESVLRAKIEKICKEKLIVYALPKEIVFGTLPLTNVGKVDRKQLS